MTQAFNMDCMVAMREFPDNFFDLAIVDPPYGININNNIGRRKGDKQSDYKKAYWDNVSPDKTYFEELLRVSKNQVIWGANHFISKIPIDSQCWFMWDKGFSYEVTFAQFELAWTSLKGTCKKIDYNAASNTNRIHPTQKPVYLYRWILKNYADLSMKILDTHLGSGSSRIAAHDMGFDFWGYELDKDYFEAQEKRFKMHTSQLTIAL